MISFSPPVKNPLLFSHCPRIFSRNAFTDCKSQRTNFWLCRGKEKSWKGSFQILLFIISCLTRLRFHNFNYASPSCALPDLISSLRINETAKMTHSTSRDFERFCRHQMRFLVELEAPRITSDLRERAVKKPTDFFSFYLLVFLINQAPVRQMN